MRTFQTTARTDPTGVLHFQVPVGSSDVEYDVVVVLQPRTTMSLKEVKEPLDWLAFIERTAGSIQDPTFRRHEQGVAEERLEF